MKMFLFFHIFEQIAICTADSRANTDQFVEMLGVSDCVDMIVCGDDTNTEPKPSPHNALKICEALGVDPAEVQIFSLSYFSVNKPFSFWSSNIWQFNNIKAHS